MIKGIRETIETYISESIIGAVLKLADDYKITEKFGAFRKEEQ